MRERKLLNRIIAAVVSLVILLSTLMLSSCGFVIRRDPGFPSGYTGGFSTLLFSDNSGLEIYWVETYDEYKTAIEKLKSHGSVFRESIVFEYEGDLFDTKYCFWFQGSKGFVKYGDDPFDRCAINVYVESYAFFKDVTIDELVFSEIGKYKCYTISQNLANLQSYNPNLSKDKLVYEKDENGGYIAYYNDKELFRIEKKREYVTEECIEAIKSSVEVIKYGNN